MKRELADIRLKQCVRSVGKKRVADLMLAGGSPYFLPQFRWGYGWPYLRGYEEVGAEELKKVAVKLKEYELRRQR